MHYIPPAPAYQAYVTREEKDDRFYDDNQWIAIACIDAYNRTKQQHYLDIAEMIYRFMMTGYDSISGGGLYWKEGDKTTKNTCSNGPGILIALQLYKITSNKNYLDTALVLYNWTNAHLQSFGHPLELQLGAGEIALGIFARSESGKLKIDS